MIVKHENNNNRISVLTIIIILLLSFILAIVASSDRLKVDYSYNGAGLELIGNEVTNVDYELLKDGVAIEGIGLLQNDVNFDLNTGKYDVTGFDPYILYLYINSEYKGIYIKLKEPTKNDVEVKLYWTMQGDMDLTEKLSKESIILKEQDSAFIKLSSYPLNLVRVDISDDCEIESLCLATGNVTRHYSFGTDFAVAVIIRMSIIFVILFLAFCSFIDKKNSEASNSAVSSIDDRNNNTASKNIISKSGAGHKYEYDYIRTLAAVLVIMMHSICDIFAPQLSKGDPGYGTLKVVLGLSLVCNTLYVMLSGALILKPKEETLKSFYLRRMTKVLIPTLCYFGLYMFLGYKKEIFANGLGLGLLDIVKSLLSGRPAYMPHIWLVYTILGLYILAPFIRMIISKITDAQLFGLLVAGFIFNVLTTYVPILGTLFKNENLHGMSFGIDTPIASWLGIFMLGYYMTTDHAKKHYNMFIISGLISLMISIYMIYDNPDLLAFFANWSPTMWLTGAGAFAFFLKFTNVFGKKNRLIELLSKYNFSIMLIHILMLMKIVLPIGWQMEYEYGHLKLCIAAMVIVSFIFSFVGSVIYDNTAVAAAHYAYDKLTHHKEKK